MPDAVRLTLLNPHGDDFVSTPVSFWLVGRRGLSKYGYLLDEPIRRGQRVQVLIDGTLSSLIDQRVFTQLPHWMRAFILRVEIYFWLRHNDLTQKIDVHWTVDTVRDRTALYVFSYKNCVGAFDQRQATISAFNYAIINLSHYFIRTREKADNIAKLRNAILSSDSDLSHNPYFRHFFPHSPRLLVTPFAVGERFATRRPLQQRSAKCAATGSFHNLKEEFPREYYRDFVDFFHTDTYHPVRKLLYGRRAEIADWLECRISPYREMEGKNGFLASLRRLLRFDMVQAEYFSFDIADFYNRHRFALVGEELSGAPAVGFFEAMACGCVMLGTTGNYYDGLGLAPDVHYLTHDGTVESIHAAIVRASKDSQRLTAIAQAGMRHIQEKCTPQAVWDALQRSLVQLSARHEP